MTLLISTTSIKEEAAEEGVEEREEELVMVELAVDGFVNEPDSFRLILHC